MIFEDNKKVYFSEIGSDYKASKGKIIDFFQNTSTLLSEKSGLGLKYLRENGKAWILHDWQIDYYNDINYMDDIVIGTLATGFRRGICKRNYYIKKENDYAVIADSTWVVYDYENDKMITPSKEELDTYKIMDPMKMRKYKGKIKKSEDVKLVSTYKVIPEYIDINDHMNNGWYVKLAESTLNDDEKNILSMRVTYSNSAKLNDDVYVYASGMEKIIEDEDGILHNRKLVLIKGNDDITYSVVEFIY